jgi:hypothetical protein
VGSQGSAFTAPEAEAEYHVFRIRASLPAWASSLIAPAAETIPRVFRIMGTSAVTARPCRGWPASGPGRLLAAFVGHCPGHRFLVSRLR